MIVRDQEYRDASIVLDGNSFTGCHFINCRIQYYGLGSVVFANNQLDDCAWDFLGPASDTIKFMAALYAGGDGGRELIEATLRNIREAPKGPIEGKMQ